MLEGKVILDLSWVLGGPFGGQLLAQLGADVIKVEPIDGDMARSIPPLRENADGPFFLSVNRGKKSVSLNLRDPKGLRVFHDLVKAADAVIYGFSSQVPKRLGIDHDTLVGVNPKIVVGELIGLHDQGPYAEAPAFDLMIQAMAGLASITGPEGGSPVRVGYQVADLAGGLYLALGTVGALLEAAETGQGRKIQVSLYDAQIAMLTWQAQGYLSGGPVPRATGARHASIAPSDIYPTRDGRYIAVAPTGERFWREFCTAIGQADLAADPRFETVSRRIENIGALTDILSAALSEKNAAEWTDIFTKARVPFSVVNRVDEALAHPLTAQREMVESVLDQHGQQVEKMLGNPIKFNGQKPLAYPPRHGEHSREVLQRYCNYEPAHIAALEQEGILRASGQKTISGKTG